MRSKTNTPDDKFTSAQEAIDNLLLPELNAIVSGGWSAALSAHTEIEARPVSQRRGAFYRHYLPLLKDLVSLLAGSYRRYFKLALAHPRQTGRNPHQWASDQLQLVVRASLGWIRDWYILACDGENQYMRRTATIEYVPGATVSLPIPITLPPFPPPQSWRAPAWLFQVAPDLGILLIRTEHVPARDSEQKLSLAHTRLLLMGARRSFRWALGAAIETVRNEEIAAAGSIPAEPANRHTPHYNKRKGWQQRIKLYEAVRKILVDAPILQGIKFCAELDKRHAPPLFDWTKTGEWREGFTWKEAWVRTSLRRKIRRVRQEAMKNR